MLTALAALTLCVGALAAAPASDLRFEEMDGTVRLCWDGVVDEDHVSYDIYFLEEGEWYYGLSAHADEDGMVEEGVTSVGHSAFAFYENITRVELPQSLESIGGCAFMGLPLLESITIPAAVASIGEEAFVASVKDGFAVAEGSEHFKAVDGVLFTADGTELVAYPGNKGGLYHVPEGTERIRCGAFTDAQVEGVALYDGMKELEAGAFQNCAAMTEMIFPVTLERIGDYAFYGCESLTTIWYDGSKEQWNEIAIGGDNECLLRATIDFRLGGEQPAVSGTVSGGAGASVAIKGEAFRWKSRRTAALSSTAPAPSMW